MAIIVKNKICRN